MKQTVCMIGPFPPPMNGNSKAFDTIIRSDICNERYNFRKIDLYRLYSGKNGKASLSKFIGIFALKKAMRKIRKEEIVDTYYISNAQTVVGCIRDIVVIKEILKQKKSCRIILHLHGGGFKAFYDNANLLLRAVIKKYYSKADTAIVLGNSLLHMFEGIVPSEKIRVIPNCVDNDMLLSDSEYDEKVYALSRADEIAILYLSNMIESKGYKDLLEAAILIHNELPKAKFYFAGAFKNEQDKQLFYDRIAIQNANGYITYMGVVGGNEKRNLIKKCSVFVLPTYYPNEGQPISIIECMSAGMAIISTNHAGIKDLVCPGINGLFVQKKSPESIKEALIEVCTKKTIEQMGKESRNIAKRNYTEKQYVDSICSVLQ